MSFLKKLFGGNDSGNTVSEPDPIDYDGYAITPTPIKEGAVFRISARIEKTIDGAPRTQTLVRADTVNSVEAANDMSVNKAKQVINERGDKLFDGPNA